MEHSEMLIVARRFICDSLKNAGRVIKHPPETVVQDGQPWPASNA